MHAHWHKFHQSGEEDVGVEERKQEIGRERVCVTSSEARAPRMKCNSPPAHTASTPSKPSPLPPYQLTRIYRPHSTQRILIVSLNRIPLASLIDLQSSVSRVLVLLIQTIWLTVLSSLPQHHAVIKPRLNQSLRHEVRLRTQCCMLRHDADIGSRQGVKT